MKNFYRIATGINVTPILIKLAHHAERWREDTYLRTFPQGPFGEVDSIICRFPPRAVPATQDEADAILNAPGYDQHECEDQPIYGLLPEVHAVVMQLFAAVGGVRLGRVIINRIQPGGIIYEHADTLAHADYWHRHHLVLKSAPGATFRAGLETVYMAPGEFWYFNNGKAPDRPKHEVINNSDGDRIHLIMDARV